MDGGSNARSHRTQRNPEGTAVTVEVISDRPAAPSGQLHLPFCGGADQALLSTNSGAGGGLIHIPLHECSPTRSSGQLSATYPSGRTSQARSSPYTESGPTTAVGCPSVAGRGTTTR